MRKIAHFLRISTALMLLVMIPWTVVLITSLRVMLKKVPRVESRDADEIMALTRAVEAYVAGWN